MPFDVNRELSATFDLVVRRHEAKALTSERDWQALEAIEKRHDRARHETERRYDQEYEARLERARADIYAERAQPTHEIEPPPGAVRVSLAEKVNTRAQARVEQDHAVAMAGIDEAEIRDIGNLMVDAAKRGELKDRAREAFSAAVDRRVPQQSRS